MSTHNIGFYEDLTKITVGNHVTIDVMLIPLWGQPF